MFQIAIILLPIQARYPIFRPLFHGFTVANHIQSKSPRLFLSHSFDYPKGVLQMGHLGMVAFL